MSKPMLLAATAGGAFIFFFGFYKLFKYGEWTLLLLGVLILISCFCNYAKNKEKYR